jgi:hypothetical protein
MHSRAMSCCFGTHPSSDADAMLPSGIAATAVTCHLWPCSLRIGCAVAAFHTMTDLSLEPAVFKAISSADHAAMLIAKFMVDGRFNIGQPLVYLSGMRHLDTLQRFAAERRLLPQRSPRVPPACGRHDQAGRVDGVSAAFYASSMHARHSATMFTNVMVFWNACALLSTQILPVRSRDAVAKPDAMGHSALTCSMACVTVVMCSNQHVLSTECIYRMSSCMVICCSSHLPRGPSIRHAA